MAPHDTHEDMPQGQSVPQSMPGVQSKLLNGSPSGNVPANKDGIAGRLQDVQLPSDLTMKAIVDLYPTSPMQQGLVALSVKGNNSYIAQWIFQLSPDVDVDSFKEAWNTVIAVTPMLRTRFLETADGVCQAVTRDRVQWKTADKLQSYLKKDREHGISLGDQTIRLGLINTAVENYFVLTAHHATYDGASILMTFKAVEQAYWGNLEASSTPYRLFIDQLESIDQTQARQYWADCLTGCMPCEFPPLPSRSYQPVASMAETQTISLPSMAIEITVASIMRAAWGLLIANYTRPGDEPIDVTYGATFSGRNSDLLPSVSNIVGPTMATVPVRVQTSRSGTVRQLLAQVQQYYLSSLPFEQLGLQTIRSVSDGASRACDFQSLLVIQGTNIDVELDKEIWSRDNKSMAPMMLTQALVLELTPVQGGYDAKANYDPHVLDQGQIRMMLYQFEQLIAQLYQGCVNDSMLVSDLEYTSVADLDQVASWNREVEMLPGTECIHTMLASTCSRHPDALAVVSDELTLSQIDLDRRSTELAEYLLQSGLGSGSNVLVCFEKSPWAIVALLGILKTGSAFVPIDPQQPVERLSYIAKQTQATVCLTNSTALSSRLSGVTSQVLVLDAELICNDTSQRTQSLPVVSIRTTAAILFTSGSTGVPKGVVMSHSCLAAAITAHSRTMAHPQGTRILQFCSLVFDHIVWEIFTALYDANVVCIPSESQRSNDLEGTLQSMQINALYLTPSLAKILDPLKLPDLHTLYVGGESIPQSLIDQWATSRRLYLGYGPTEASLCTGLFAMRDTKSGDIGLPINTRCWVVNMGDLSTLAPVGVAGELLCEGPLLAAGYLNNEELTTSAFLEDPPWSRDSRLGLPSEKRRFYKTGDIVRYKSDGRLEFLGRKDGQIKLRGQRVELREVQHHLSQLLPRQAQSTVLALPAPGSASGNLTLAAFISLRVNTHGDNSTELEVPSSPDELREFAHLLRGIDSKLGYSLPVYMVPTVYIPVTGLPITSTGKIDGRRLESFASGISVDQLRAFSSGTCAKIEPKGKAQRLMQHMWSAVLGAEAESIGANDHFLRLGGDSISAMRLVAQLRNEGFFLSVQDVFRRPVLADMAKALTESSVLSELVAPFSLVGAAKQELLEYASHAANVELEGIEDIFPATPLQEGLVVLSSKSPGTFVSRTVFDLPQETNISLLKQAWEIVVQRTAILRTVFFQSPTSDLMQAVLRKPSVEWTHSDSLEEYMKTETIAPMTLGQKFFRYAIICDEASAQRHFVFSAHHSTYDGWSINLLYKQVAEVYTSLLSDPRVPLENGHALENSLKTFIAHLQDTDAEASRAFWKRQLAACPPPSFPQLPSVDYMPSADCRINRTITVPHRVGSSITTSTIIRAAWAMVISRYSDTEDDVVFGATLNGRSAPVAGIEDVIGPTITTVPVRITLEDPKARVSSFLEKVQNQAADMFPYEQYGLRNIRKINDEARVATEFQTLLLIEAETVSAEDDTKLIESCFGGRPEVASNSQNFSTMACTLQCFLRNTQNGSLVLDHSLFYDSAVLDPRQMRRLQGQFEWVFSQLWAEEVEQTLEDIVMLSPDDRNEIERWNQGCPAPLEAPVHDLFHRMADRQPDAPAAASCAEGEITYRQLDEFSSKLANLLIGMQIGPRALIPVLFEKSIWTIVVIYGILKAGSAVVFLDPLHPSERLSGLIEDVQGPMVISSRECTEKALLLHSKVLTVDRPMLEELATSATRPPSIATPTDSAFILFTSGSTGKPKGIDITHTSVSSSINGHGWVLNFTTGPGSRNFNFTAYSSDVSMSEITSSLAMGSCVCVPSQWERMNDIAGAMERLRVNWAFFTPSVATLIHPDAVPTLRTLCFGGETATPELMATWAPRLHLINSFGPAECTVWTHANPHASADDIGSNIGFGLGYSTWITEPGNHNRLAPIGAVGELCVEGPAMARGYINNPEKTAAAFVSMPAFMPQGDKDRRIYRMGDMARYLPNGMVQFLGRRDTQVKLRGQRIELGEVEHQLRTCIPSDLDSAVEAIKPGGNAPILAAFIAIGLDPGMEDMDDSETEVIVTSQSGKARFEHLTEKLYAKLTRLLPQHMIPSAFLPLYKMPLTASSKTDRKKLRQMGSMMPRDEMDSFAATNRVYQAPTTPSEKRLHELWKSLLSVERDISLDESFFHLGGDSLQAMRLVVAAQAEGLRLTVADVFKHATLGAMAMASKDAMGLNTTVNSVTPFSLIPGGSNGLEIRREAASQCGMPIDEVEDIYPTTPLQTGMFALSQRSAGSYHGQFCYRLIDIDVGRFKKAWETVVAATPLLRTCFTQVNGTILHVTMQYGGVRWAGGDNLERYMEEDVQRRMHMGDPLARFALIDDANRDSLIFVLSGHHAIYDGWSMDLLFNAVEAAYQQRTGPPLFNFNNFIGYLQRLDSKDSERYWRNQLEDCPKDTFPQAQPDYLPAAHSCATRDVPLHARQGSNITTSTIIRAAWALVLADLSDVNDVVFGASLNGRTQPVRGLQSMIGPAIATVPVRIRMKNWTVVEFLGDVQKQATDMFAFEQFGIQNIRKLSDDALFACNFLTLVVIQTATNRGPSVSGAETGRDKGLFKHREMLSNISRTFHNFAICVEVNLSESGVFLEATYDEAVISDAKMDLVLTSFDTVLRKLWSEDSKMRISEVVGSEKVRSALAATEEDRVERTQRNDGASVLRTRARRPQYKAPQTLAERILHRAWTQVLGCQPDSFGALDSFFMLGGDSIKAMALVVALNKIKRHLSVEQIFQSPDLAGMAASMQRTQIGGISEPFEMVAGNIDSLLDAVSAKSNVARHTIEDVYPCTPLQEAMMALSMKDNESYVARFVYTVPQQVDLARLRLAWNEFYARSPILRTCLVENPETESSSRILQLVSRRDVQWRTGKDLSAYLSIDKESHMTLGSELSRFAVIEDDRVGQSYLVLTLHHAVYDGVTINQAWEAVSSLYHGRTPEPLADYRLLIKSLVEERDESKSQSYWESQLRSLDPPTYPRYPTPNYSPKAGRSHTRQWSFTKQTGSNYTAATLIRAAWSILLQQHGDGSGVGYLAVISGRARSVQGIATMDGPVAATVPVHTDVNLLQSLGGFLDAVQHQSVEMTPYEQDGLQNIKRFCPDADQKGSLDFRALLAIQTPAESSDDTGALGVQHQPSSKALFSEYPLAAQFTIRENAVEAGFQYDSHLISGKEIERFAARFEYLMKEVGARPLATTLRDLNCVSPSEMAEITSWNVAGLQETPACLHHLFAQQVKLQPDAPAVSSYDGDLTYSELDGHSTTIANMLATYNIQPDDLVPLCFEKSLWFIVAALGVWKAGGAYVPIDPEYPDSRIQQVLSQVKPKVILSAERLRTRLSEYGVPTEVVSQVNVSVENCSSPVSRIHPGNPSDLAYVLFTSGSTGTPKGVTIEHGSITASVRAHGRRMDFGPHCRVSQLAPYTFDVSVAEIFTTLVHGGCVCSPSEQERMGGIVEFLNTREVNYAAMTPSYIRMLPPDKVPGLQLVVLGGEPVRQDNIDAWAGRVRLMNGYGPTEASVLATVHDVGSTAESARCIGRTLGAASWVADPEDSNKLVSIGAIGELLLQGEIVARGYLDDAEKTLSSFIEPPSFLEGSNTQLGSRVYKTGDLVRYRPDGDLEILGRKDMQAKINGQRLELGEVEYQAKVFSQDLDIPAAEVVTLADSMSQVLVLYMVPCSPDINDASCADQVLSMVPELRERCQKIKSHLENVLPRFMVPSLFVPVPSVPMTGTGKVDRAHLREIVRSLDPASRSQYDLTKQDEEDDREPPQSEEEKLLQSIWSRVLGRPMASIARSHNFFRLGGDSVLAIMVVSEARNEKQLLTAKDIFKNPVLSQLALRMAPYSTEMDRAPAPFTLLDPAAVAPLQIETQVQCKVPEGAIEDILPPTALQTGLMILSMQQTGSYTARFPFKIPPTLELEQFKTAWAQVGRMLPTLRTRMVYSEMHGMYQVVLRAAEPVTDVYMSLAEFQTSHLPMGLGDQLSYASIVHDEVNKINYFVWAAHHSVYDGISIGIVLSLVQEVYRGNKPTAPPPFSSFIRYLKDTDSAETEDFWRRQLAGATASTFPALPKSDYRARADRSVFRDMELRASSRSDNTMTNVLRAAWALVLSTLENSLDVSFGCTVGGRSASVPGINDMAGPIFATFPMRCVLDPSKSVLETIDGVQQMVADIIPHEQLGLQKIAKLSDGCAAGCAYRSHHIVQHYSDSLFSKGCLGFEQVHMNAGHFYTYPIVMTCSLGKGKVTLNANYDTNLFSIGQIDRIVDQYERIIAQMLGAVLDTKIDDVTLMGDKDLELIKEWNSGRAKTNRWIVDSRDHNKLTPIGGVGELLLEEPLLEAEDITKTHVVPSPLWGTSIGRTLGQLYTTGELVRYLENGDIEHLGRKDTQIKIHGQPVAIGDIELHMREILGDRAMAYVAVSPYKESQDGECRVLAFITDNRTQTLSEASFVCETEDVRSRLGPLVEELGTHLKERLHTLCLPSAYLALHHIPICPTGKLDRSALTATAADLTVEMENDLCIATGSYERQPSSENEKLLQAWWAQALAVPAADLVARSHFFRAGGDSLKAMRLVALARDARKTLTVRNVFNNPLLEDMAACIVESRRVDISYTPFETTSTLMDKDDMIAHISSRCQIPNSTIEDILVCTPMQEVFVEHLEHHPGCSVVQNVFRLSPTMDLTRFQKAWAETVKAVPMLRTRMVKTDNRILQVVGNEAFSWKTAKTTRSALDRDAETPMGLHDSLSRYTIVEDGRSGVVEFIWTIHHAIYDGWSLSLILRHLEQAYQQSHDRIELASMGPYLKHLDRLNGERTRSFWRKTLGRSDVRPWFPDIQFNANNFRQDRMMDFLIRMHDNNLAVDGISPATLAYAAWALAGSKLSESPDVSLLLTLTGRDLPLRHIETISGPTIAQAPALISVDPELSTLEFLKRAQNAVNDMMPFSHVGPKNIASASSEAAQVVANSPPLVIHTVEQRDKLVRSGSSMGLEPVARFPLGNNPYLFSLDCVASHDNIHLYITFDSDHLPAERITTVVKMYEKAVLQLQNTSAIERVGDVDLEVSDEARMGLRYLPISKDFNLLPFDTEYDQA